MSKEWRRGENNSDSSTNSNSFDGTGNGNGSGSSGGDDNLFFDDGEEDDSSEEEPGFFVKVETMMGTTFEVYAYPNDNIELLKTRIAFQEGILQKDQNLFLSHGRIPLNNSAALLSDLGLTEATSQFKPLRLVTNISSGVGSKGFASRDSSPPPPPFNSQLPFQQLHPMSSSISSGRRRDRRRHRAGSDSNDAASNDDSVHCGRRNMEARLEDNQNPELLQLPRINGLTNDGFDGLMLFEERGNRRYCLVVTKKSSEGLLGQDSTDTVPNSVRIRRPPPTTISSFLDEYGEAEFDEVMSRRSSEAAKFAEAHWIFQNDIVRHKELYSGREQDSGETQRQVDRVKENAKTLKKMNQIRNNLSSKKKVVFDSDYSNMNQDRNGKTLKHDENHRMNHLPDINEKNCNSNYTRMSKYQHNVSTQWDENFTNPLFSRAKTTTNKVKSETDFNRTITSSMASLNRLRAEIYLEAKKTGKGNFGIPPYTNNQLLKYVQLKIKVLLADQNPVDYDYLSPQRFVLNPKPKCITPTVLVKKEQYDTDSDAETPLRILTPKIFETENDENEKKIKRHRNFSQRIKNRPESSTSTCDSNVNTLKEKSNNNMTRLVTAKSLQSDDSLKSGRLLRRQKSQISGGISVRSSRSAGKRPHSGSVTVPAKPTTKTLPEVVVKGELTNQQRRTKDGFHLTSRKEIDPGGFLLVAGGQKFNAGQRMKTNSDNEPKNGPPTTPSQERLNPPGSTIPFLLPPTSTSPSEAVLHSTQSTSTTIQKKKKDIVRCSECRKRIGVSCRYQCRCGKLFCSTHRYAETHNCTYDYKTEGRREITEANPLIVASKVDKI